MSKQVYVTQRPLWMRYGQVGAYSGAYGEVLNTKRVYNRLDTDETTIKSILEKFGDGAMLTLPWEAERGHTVEYTFRLVDDDDEGYPL